ncbi:uncharacterized protein L969DRAFT_93630 [Mixia osmundae IAM 14324]|uniref:Methyltransferase small domain-containing protein n=1 Tax=Mixia osmundae (strain CBS 9802 / IAM 14324 / JCM 22182 / KY 12970) TaxID=764103 RepID=G7E949_MIXOS|nr:uncharacterized protein L969DRAFT_93630 [Mixia osmundae IAM 14324]KEI39788.1 hypothetical protein L969DRAFT_93630 [Mixia osmundae IAM 14324]GAA99168.1 hypothetical protein E5Q_05860 [Mixia osmundae IAM 14324]
MLATPDLSHLTRADWEHVYEPAEDTFVLLDALELDAAWLRSRQHCVCLELGSGSGCVSAFLAKIIGNQHLFLATDLNPYACSATARTAARNEVAVDIAQADLFSGLKDRLKGRIDVLIFNPPYVETEEDEQLEAQMGKDVQGAWAGGDGGMTVTNRVLDALPDLLSARGIFYLVAISQNDPQAIIESLNSRHFFAQISLKRRAGREHLHIIRCTR